MKTEPTVFTLENDDLIVKVERHGAQLASIFDKKANREVLWGADPAVWNRHAPILFPFVGKSFDGKYHMDGKEYAMTAHGFARDLDFEPVMCDMDECWFRLTDSEATKNVYPFAFELEVGHRLNGRSVEVLWKVTNRESKEMLFMIGGHPAFQVPQGKTIYDYSLEFSPKRKSVHYQAPNADGFVEEELSGNLALTDGRVKITKGFFDTALTYIFDQGQIDQISLLVDEKPYVTVACPGFPMVGVWTIEATHPFVCLEPWYGRCDKQGWNGELVNRDGVEKLEAFSEWEKSYQIIIH